MTAEIAILNKSAVALAADSKVTLTVGGSHKTYDTVDKLFSISKHAPMGAMIYGNAEFMGFPWETLIKEYRRRNPTKEFETVFDWSSDLLKFLGGFFEFSDEEKIKNSTTIAISELDNLIRSALENVPREELMGINFDETVFPYLEKNISEIEELEDYFEKEEWDKLDRQIDQKLNEEIKKIRTNDQAVLSAFLKFTKLFLRKNKPSSMRSGLVVAGFGESELMPSLVQFEIDGFVGDRIKCIEVESLDVSRRSLGAIMPFAQRDMVDRFMLGVDPTYLAVLEEAMSGQILQNSIEIAKKAGVDLENNNVFLEEIAPIIRANSHQYLKEQNQIRHEIFATPIIEMAMKLPKDELANMAESLVSLTSLQRRVSRDIETVGGAIDVAVISKGDGFVWVNRKHYFPAEKNIRFVNGYFSEYHHSPARGESK